jgi:membrane associated rhomboid family serine protease|tara:strand:- start:13 stop:492 length:480 start_codon:yes stop_codon:yes gene_type:complete
VITNHTTLQYPFLRFSNHLLGCNTSWFYGATYFTIGDNDSPTLNRYGGVTMSIQAAGAILILVAMFIALWPSEEDDYRKRPIPLNSKIVALILVAVAAVDLFLWLFDEQTFTGYIQDLMGYFSGFVVMWCVFGIYWRRRGLKEATEVLIGILMGHFWWS